MLTLHKDTPNMPKAVADVANALSAIGLDVRVVPSYYAHTPLTGFCVYVGDHTDRDGFRCALFELGFFNDGTLDDYNNDSGSLHQSFGEPVPPLVAKDKEQTRSIS